MPRGAKFFFVAIAIVLIPRPLLAARLQGKLKTSAPDSYKIVGIEKSGRSTVATVSNKGKFSINLKKGATLHVVGTNNRYVGPVVASKGTKAYPAVSGIAGNIGNVALRDGFATAPFGKSNTVFSKKPSITFNKSSGPRGAGNLGLVSVAGISLKPKAGDPKVGDDTDSDGLPNLIDVDDDGDIILDVSDPVSGAAPDFETQISSTLRTTLPDGANANIGGITDTQIDAVLQNGLILGLFLRKNLASATIENVNIDCGSLPYCAGTTGTAEVRSDDLSSFEGQPWRTYDPDNDGLPNLVSSVEPAHIGIKPKAAHAQVNPGDTLYFRIDLASGSATIPALLPFYFVTAPALKEYVTGVETRTISYPVSQSGMGTSVDDPLPLATGAITLRFWRPQRPAIAGAETGSYVDSGRLRYGLTVSSQVSSSVIICDGSDYSNPAGGLQAIQASGTTSQPFEDTAADAAVNSANLLSFDVNLAACLSRAGVATSNAVVYIDLNATSINGDQTSQSFYMKLPA